MGTQAQSNKENGRASGRDFSLSGWRVVLSDAGISHRNVLRRAGLPDDLFGHDQPRVSTEEYYRLWRAMEEETGDPNFPLVLLRSMTPEAFDPAIFAAMCSPDLNTALDRIRTYKALCGPMRLEVAQRPDVTVLSIHFPPAAEQLPPSLVLGDITFFVGLARMCTREEVRPLAITSLLPLSADTNLVRQAFGVSIERGEANTVTFSAGDAARPFLTVNDAMWRFFQPELRRRLDELRSEATTAERVRAALLEMLPSGTASTERVADKLGMSKRTLQRRLSGEGSTFQQLLDETREQLARHYLQSSSMSGAEISFLLGYDDPNSFFRAFHTWTGRTPETVRAELRH